MAGEEGGLRSAVAVAEWGVDEEGIRLWPHSPGHTGHQRVDEALWSQRQGKCLCVCVCVCVCGVCVLCVCVTAYTHDKCIDEDGHCSKLHSAPNQQPSKNSSSVACKGELCVGDSNKLHHNNDNNNNNNNKACTREKPWGARTSNSL